MCCRIRSIASWLLAAWVLVGQPVGPLCLHAQANLNPKRWEQSIRNFETVDQRQPPPKGAILFVGSSSIRLWDLNKSFPDLTVINRGFGGSQIEDSVYYADRIIIPYEPKVIVLYAGDNDINAGKNPERVFSDYKDFVKTVHAALPKTQIVYIAIKPSIARWHLVERMREANGRIQEFTERDGRLNYVDIDTPMIGEDGKPRKALFLKDGLHLNAEGYKLWTSLVMPYLQTQSGSQ